MKIYLYLKTHNVTGLKYLGKTIATDPHKYRGSGKRWSNHIRKHGYDVTTEILKECSNQEELKFWGLHYSNMWDIVNNEEFANIVVESGEGGDTSNSPAYKKGIRTRDTSGSKNSMYGKSAIVENNIRWYNDGVTNLYVPSGTQPDNFIPGRIITYKKPHTKETKNKLAQYGTKTCVSPTGEIFTSFKEAAKAYNISSVAISGLIKRGKSGWKLL